MLAGKHKLGDILTGRTARNVYFWAILIYTRFEYKYDGIQAAFTAILFCLLAMLFYVNNLVLIPSYLSKKKYATYLTTYTLLSIIVSLVYTLVLKMILLHYPSYSPGLVSALVAGGETPSFTLSAFTTDWLSYLIIIFITGCIFAMSWYVIDYQRQQKQIEQIKKSHLEMELAFLKNQINPHFLFNSLNNLYALTVKKSDIAPEVVSKISTLLRYLLYESDRQTVNFEKEKEIMHAYIDIELLRIPNTSNMHFTIESDKEYYIPPLLWLPILENVFKHGTRFISKSFEIVYRFTIIDNVLYIYSRNTFKQEPPETHQQTNGIGLLNLTQRLNLLFYKKYSMKQTIENGNYITDIKIQLDIP